MSLQAIEKSRNNWYVCVWLFRTKKTSECEPCSYYGRSKTCKHEVNNVFRMMTMLYAKYLSITDIRKIFTVKNSFWHKLLSIHCAFSLYTLHYNKYFHYDASTYICWWCGHYSHIFHIIRYLQGICYF